MAIPQPYLLRRPFSTALPIRCRFWVVFRTLFNRFCRVAGGRRCQTAFIALHVSFQDKTRDMNSRPELLPLRSTHQAQPVAARWSLDWSERFIPTESLCNEQHNVLNKTYISQFPMRSQQNPAVNSQKVDR